MRYNLMDASFLFLSEISKKKAHTGHSWKNKEDCRMNFFRKKNV